MADTTSTATVPSRRRGQEMTPRARAYLTTASARHISIGALLLAMPGSFTTSSLIQIKAVMTLTFWAGVFLICGWLCVLAAVRQSEALSRVALVGSAAATALWAGGFLISAYEGQLSNPALPIVFGALAAKDLIVCAQPLRSPFERLAEELGA